MFPAPAAVGASSPGPAHQAPPAVFSSPLGSGLSGPLLVYLSTSSCLLGTSVGWKDNLLGRRGNTVRWPLSSHNSVDRLYDRKLRSTEIKPLCSGKQLVGELEGEEKDLGSG